MSIGPALAARTVASVAEPRRRKILVLDNDEMSGSYHLVFAYMAILQRMLQSTTPFYQLVRASQLALARDAADSSDASMQGTEEEPAVEDTRMLVLQSFARSMAKFAPNTIFRPGFVEFLQYAYDLKRTGAIDAIVMYTAAADGEGGKYIEGFMSTLLAASIQKEAKQVFDLTISRDRQRTDEELFHQLFQPLVQPNPPRPAYQTPIITIRPALRILTDAWFAKFQAYTAADWLHQFQMSNIPSPEQQFAIAQNTASLMHNVNDRKSTLYVRALLTMQDTFATTSKQKMDILMFDDSISGIQAYWTYTPPWAPSFPGEPVPADAQTVRAPPGGETQQETIARRLYNYEKIAGSIRHSRDIPPSKIVQVSKYNFKPNVEQAMGLFIYSLCDLAREVNNNAVLNVLLATTNDQGQTLFDYANAEFARLQGTWPETSPESTHQDSGMMKTQLELFVDPDRLETARLILQDEEDSDISMERPTDFRLETPSESFCDLDSAVLGSYLEETRRLVGTLDLGLIGGCSHCEMSGALDVSKYTGDCAL